MSANKARKIVRIHPDPDPDKWMVTVEDKDGATSVVLLAALVRPELARAAKVAFPDTDGRGWIHYPNEAIRQAIITSTLPEGIADAIGKMQAPRPQSAGDPKRDAVLERLEARIRELENQAGAPPQSDLQKVIDHEGTLIYIGVVPPEHIRAKK